MDINEIINIPAFLYKWTDHKYDMYYIGAHKGTPDDGYVCSSKYMLEEYNKRPEDFTREILLIGNPEYIWEMETQYLKNVDAARNSKYYNRTNGDGEFVSLGPVSKETRKNISKAMKGKSPSKKQRENQSKAKTGKRPTIETRNRMSKSQKKTWTLERRKEESEKNKGEKNNFFNKIHSDETKEFLSKNTKRLFEMGVLNNSGENHPNYKYNPDEVLKYSCDEAMEIFGISRTHFYKIKRDKKNDKRR